MIGKIVFLALVGVACVQGAPPKFPQFHLPSGADKDVLTEQVAKTNSQTKSGEQSIPNNIQWTNVSEEEQVTENTEDNAQAATHHVAEANDEAHETHTPHHVPPVVTDKSPYGKPVTEHQTQKPGANDFFDIFGHAIHDVVNENADNFNKEVGSVMNVGKSVVDAAKTIADSKIQLANSFPRIGGKLFEAWGRK